MRSWCETRRCRWRPRPGAGGRRRPAAAAAGAGAAPARQALPARPRPLRRGTGRLQAPRRQPGCAAAAAGSRTYRVGRGCDGAGSANWPAAATLVVLAASRAAGSAPARRAAAPTPTRNAGLDSCSQPGRRGAIAAGAERRIDAVACPGSAAARRVCGSRSSTGCGSILSVRQTLAASARTNTASGKQVVAVLLPAPPACAPAP